MTDEAICVLEYIEESGNIESVKVSSFRKYLSNPEKTYEILYFDSKKWALDSSLTEQILYDERYKEKLIDDATYIEITNGKCMWSGPKVNKKSFFPGILQTSMVLRIRDSEDKTNSEHSFKYVIKK